MHIPKSKGFSLVELSIVLVILGLLVGGILAGKSLIRASELRSISRDAQQYTAARNSFRDKYFALPGDFATATAIWGKSATYCNGDSGTAATPGTCNGDGNGIIGYTGGANAASEGYAHWAQLALAGLITGTYTGISDTTGSLDHAPGTNCPATSFPNVGWSASYADNSSGASTNSFNYDYRSWLHIAADTPPYLDGSFLKPEEAWNVDSKMDDGMPGTGRVIGSFNALTCTTAAGSTDRGASYQLNDTNNRCALLFKPN